MRITVYGKEHCGKCDSCKAKLERMHLPYEFKLMQQVISAEIHDTDAMAAYCMHNQDLPIVVIDDCGYSYSEAMKHLKERSKPRETP